MKLVTAFVVLLFSLLPDSSTAEDFDFFYLVQQVLRHVVVTGAEIDRDRSASLSSDQFNLTQRRRTNLI